MLSFVENDMSSYSEGTCFNNTKEIVMKKSTTANKPKQGGLKNRKKNDQYTGSLLG